MVQRDRVDRGVDAATGEQRRERRGEPQSSPALLGEVERLDAEPVANEVRAARVGLDDRERKHAGESLEQRFAPVGPAAEDHLGVRGRREAHPSADQLVAELAVVVDAAVEREREAVFLGDHRLGAGVTHVDDAQPPVHESDARAQPRALAVGAARLEHAAHLRQRPFVDWQPSCDLSGKATHRSAKPDRAGRASPDRVPDVACKGGRGPVGTGRG